MTTDLVQGVRAGRHTTAGVEEWPVPEEELAIYGQALASMDEAAFGSWPAGRRRHLGEVRAHLAPILSRQALAASFGRESFHRQQPATVDTAPARIIRSPVLAAYATRWLELADAWCSPRAGVDRDRRARASAPSARRRSSGGAQATDRAQRRSPFC